jgi:hypothetical protein
VSDRYTGNPWRRVLDAFVLWSIGALDDKSSAALEEMTPKLRQTFGMTSGSWQQVVMQQMDFDDAYLAWLREKWRRQQEFDRTIGQPSDPIAWAFQISDFIGTGEVPSAS